MKIKLTNIFTKSLDKIEYVGNRLPHPATIFALLSFSVIIFSWLGNMLSLSAIHPADNSVITVKNLLSSDGIRWMYTNITTNFVAFPPLVNVLTIIIGIGVAEGTGFFNTLFKSLVLRAPKKLITPAIIFAGVTSHLASDAGYVILIPLGAMIFHAIGRHPLAGLAAAFAGVSGGFGANLFIGSVDPILAGLSQTSAQIIDPAILINPVVNFYFMFTSTFLIVILGTIITEKIIEPRLGPYAGSTEKMAMDEISPIERKALMAAGISALVFIILLLISIVPEGGILRNPETNEVLHSPFFSGIIVGVALLFFIPGLTYGIIVRTIKSDKDLMQHIIKSMGTLASYIVMVFFAAQFVYFFRHSNLGLILAVEGAHFLKNIGLTGVSLLIAFVLLSAFINLFMGSASAKWAIMAPVFVPMFMLLGYHPALTQAAYRIGDSVTNIITPLLPYFALIVAFAQKYQDKTGIGTIISMMLPYSILFLIAWTILLVIWVFVGFPVGPDGPLYYPTR